MGLKEQVYKHFDAEMEKVKLKRPDVYQGLLNHHKKSFYRDYFLEQIGLVIEKRAKAGFFNFDSERIRKLVADCIDFYVFAFIIEKRNMTESVIAKQLREEADRKARMHDLAAVKNEFTDELEQIKDYVQDNSERDTNDSQKGS